MSVVMGDVLEELADFFRRFVILTPAQADTLALWAAHTHVFHLFAHTPYLAITSPTKRAGKTLLLSSLELLVARPWRVVDVTPAALFRKVADARPTMLIDELDASGVSAHLRSLLNAGFEKGGTIPRVETIAGERVVVEFSAYCPKAFAGIGRPLPTTVADRSIPIRLQRRAPDEPVERFRVGTATAISTALRNELVVFLEGHTDHLANSDPAVPDELHDRTQDIWVPLMALAEVAGPAWVHRASHAALEVSAGIEEEDPAVNLLADIRAVFETTAAAKLATAELLGELARLEDPHYDRETPDPARLARILREFGISPKTLRVGPRTPKGYERAQFEDAWRRYLRPQQPQHPQRREPLELTIAEAGAITTPPAAVSC